MKPWYKSKILWLNVAVGVGAVIELNLVLIRGSLAPQYYLLVLAFVNGANIALRFATHQPVGAEEK